MADTIWQFEGYESVFIEDDHYLYACREPSGWAWYFACNVWRPIGNGEYIVEDTCGADYEYLAKLETAPIDVAAEIVWIDTKRVLAYHDEMDEDEKDSYLYYKACQLSDWSGIDYEKVYWAETEQ